MHHKKKITIKPRQSTWLPQSGPHAPLDCPVYTIRPPKTASFSFAKSARRSVLITPGPNEKRFMFNPRDARPDPFDITHCKSCFIGPSKAGVSFDHMIPREPELRGRRNQPIRVINSENINRILDKLSTQHRVITPDFNMFKARYRKDQKLPAFMENLNNRMAITGLSFEMLRANNALDYEESEAPFSSFGGKRSFNVGLSRKTPGLVTVSGSEFKTYSPTCTILV